MSSAPPRRPLTSYSHGAGCGCKLPITALGDVLKALPPAVHPELLVGSDTGDDAAVYRLADDRAVVATIDFFTPIVDDARTWGRIAATNAVSDIYAMGARPLLALNVVAWNLSELGPQMLVEVLAGGQEAANEAGFVIAGGHSIDDPEPKYGLAVIGEVDPSRLLTNAGFRPGDVLVLTKPLGVGVLTTAIKQGLADETALAPAIKEMSRLNSAAAELAVSSGAAGATDITGFGLLGHLLRAANESRVAMHLHAEAAPLLPEVMSLIGAGAVPGGGRRNVEHVRGRLGRVTIDDQLLIALCDPQTSGGLVFGVDSARVDEVRAALAATGHTAAVIGQVFEGRPGLVVD